MVETGIILLMHPANERRRYIVTSFLTGWAQTQNDPWFRYPFFRLLILVLLCTNKKDTCFYAISKFWLDSFDNTEDIRCWKKPFYKGNRQRASNVCTLLVDHNEHVAARLDSFLTDRRTSLSRPLASDVSVDKRMGVKPIPMWLLSVYVSASKNRECRIQTPTYFTACIHCFVVCIFNK